MNEFTPRLDRLGRPIRLKHGQALGSKRSKLYRAWLHMMGRCYNQSNDQYPNYGGRGVKVCLRWRDRIAFFCDMGEPPKDLTLDRIDTFGHYSCGICTECIDNGWPMNCRWASMKVQQNNRRNNIRGTLNGIEMTVHEAAPLCGVHYSTLYKWMRNGMTMDEAAAVPKRIKLDADKVRAIRAAYAAGGTTYQNLAAQYGVNSSLIGFIIRRVEWKEVE